jgi:hypothetical protein
VGSLDQDCSASTGCSLRLRSSDDSITADDGTFGSATKEVVKSFPKAEAIGFVGVFEEAA